MADLAKLTALCLLLIFVTFTNGIRPNGISDVDISREVYSNLQDDMWRVINSKMRKTDAQDRVYATYKTLTERNWTERITDDSFPIMKRFYEWNLLEKDIYKIQGMWDEFRNFIQSQYVTENFNELAAIDFTETVFHDKQLTLNESLDQMHLIMVQQNLYYKTATVSPRTVF